MLQHTVMFLEAKRNTRPLKASYALLKESVQALKEQPNKQIKP